MANLFQCYFRNIPAPHQTLINCKERPLTKSIFKVFDNVFQTADLLPEGVFIFPRPGLVLCQLFVKIGDFAPVTAGKGCHLGFQLQKRGVLHLYIYIYNSATSLWTSIPATCWGQRRNRSCIRIQVGKPTFCSSCWLSSRYFSVSWRCFCFSICISCQMNKNNTGAKEYDFFFH